MMLNSRFELSKIEKNTRVEREICLAALENREWQENLFLPLSKIESRKKIISCQQKEKWELSNFRDRERNFSFYSRFFSRERDSCQCLPRVAKCQVFQFTRTKTVKPDFTPRKARKSRHFQHFKPTKENLRGFF